MDKLNKRKVNKQSTKRDTLTLRSSSALMLESFKEAAQHVVTLG